MPACGAKSKRTGQPCRQPAMANGRCRIHGGKSTGPRNPARPVGNKRARTHGAYEAIWYDVLSDDEKQVYHAADTALLAQLDAEIRLLDIRERRMLQRIKVIQEEAENDLSDAEQSKDEDTETKVDSAGWPVPVSKVKVSWKKRSKGDRIHAIEEALTKVQAQKARLLELKHAIEKGEGPHDDSGLAALADALRASAAVLAAEQAGDGG